MRHALAPGLNLVRRASAVFRRLHRHRSPHLPSGAGLVGEGAAHRWEGNGASDVLAANDRARWRAGMLLTLAPPRPGRLGGPHSRWRSTLAAPRHCQGAEARPLHPPTPLHTPSHTLTHPQTPSRLLTRILAHPSRPLLTRCPCTTSCSPSAPSPSRTYSTRTSATRTAGRHTTRVRVCITTRIGYAYYEY